ncbi:MAG: minor capsid protein [Vicinamibacterales bacterium]
MGAAEEIGALLVADGVVGASLVFYGALPDDTPDKCLAIIPSPSGLPPGRKFGQAGIGYDRPRFQILCRGDRKDYQSAEALALAAYESVAAVQAATLSGTFYHGLEPAAAPGYVGEDKNRRPLFSLNVQGEREP